MVSFLTKSYPSMFDTINPSPIPITQNLNISHCLIVSATSRGKQGNRGSRPRPGSAKASYFKSGIKVRIYWEKATKVKQTQNFNCRGLAGNIESSCVADNVHYPAKFITHGKTTPCNYYRILPQWRLEWWWWWWWCNYYRILPQAMTTGMVMRVVSISFSSVMIMMTFIKHTPWWNWSCFF